MTADSTPPAVTPDEIRERVADVIRLARADPRGGITLFDFAVADAVLAVLDPPTLMAMLGAEQRAWEDVVGGVWPLTPLPPTNASDVPLYRFTTQEGPT